jgi:RNA polymerase sigma-70 factor (sigma-E family)
MEPFAGLARHVSVEKVAEEEARNIAMGPMSSSDLSTLYRRQRAAMIRLARLLTGSTAVAEEVVQEAFLRMQQLVEQPDNPDGYLRTTVANISKGHLRRVRLERRVPDREQRLTFNDPEIDETWAAVCRLPFRQRAVLALRFYEDMSEAEIAGVLGCRPGTVKSSLHRGLSKLREEMS